MSFVDGFSAIARSVMISAANKLFSIKRSTLSFSAIARSVMISASATSLFYVR